MYAEFCSCRSSSSGALTLWKSLAVGSSINVSCGRSAAPWHGAAPGSAVQPSSFHKGKTMQKQHQWGYIQISLKARQRWRINSMVLIDHQLLWIPRKAALRNTPFQDVVICGKAADAEQGKACKNEQRHLLWFSFGRFTAAQTAPEGQEIQTTETSLHLLWSCRGNVSFHGAHNFTDFESYSFITFHAQSGSRSISYDISDTFWHWGGKLTAGPRAKKTFFKQLW